MTMHQNVSLVKPAAAVIVVVALLSGCGPHKSAADKATCDAVQHYFTAVGANDLTGGSAAIDQIRATSANTADAKLRAAVLRLTTDQDTDVQLRADVTDMYNRCNSLGYSIKLPK
jgi:hypothetical protein